MRLTGGAHRGQRLRGVGHRRLVRPTQSAIRETLFNWLHNDLANWSCLDLCAGSGVLSWEALSRGATQLALIEKERALCARLNQQATVMRSSAQIAIFCVDARHWLQNEAKRARPIYRLGPQPSALHETGVRYDLIFLDPPYASAMLLPVLELIARKDLLEPGGFLFYEAAQALDLSARLSAAFLPYRTARRGQTHFGLLRQARSASV